MRDILQVVWEVKGIMGRFPQHLIGKRTPTSVRRRSSRVDFRLRNPSSSDVVFVMKALFSKLDPQNRVGTNSDFVIGNLPEMTSF